MQVHLHDVIYEDEISPKALTSSKQFHFLTLSKLAKEVEGDRSHLAFVVFLGAINIEITQTQHL